MASVISGKLTAAKELLALLKEELKQSKEDEKAIRTVIEAQTKQLDALKSELSTANVLSIVDHWGVFHYFRSGSSRDAQN